MFSKSEYSFSRSNQLLLLLRVVLLVRITTFFQSRIYVADCIYGFVHLAQPGHGLYTSIYRGEKLGLISKMYVNNEHINYKKKNE